ncbi:MAG: alpha/beta hydrolase [Bryobacteraceae bacterium]|jgi:acetyl esterase/lipase
MLRFIVVGISVAALACAQVSSAKTQLLWPAGAPGATGSEEADKPSLTFYLPAPAKAVGTGVVVCPGGGYGHLAMDHEGQQIAEWLNSLGVAAFVLKYRLGPKYHHPIELGDSQRAVRLVRTRAREFGIAADRIGIWGFSAGGHLASTAATHFDPGNPAAPDPVDRAGSRPDFAILAYPVITMRASLTHMGSRTNLLGENPDPALVALLSNESQVTAATPPTFLFHTTDDNVVPVENSILFYEALRKAGVPAELHVFEHGPHGVGLAPRDATLSLWPALLANWLRGRGLLARAN